MNEKDWELINAYHDGELDDAERRALESRLASEPLLEEALRDVSSVSAGLGALRPETPSTVSLQAGIPANKNVQPWRWLVGSTAAAAIVLAIAVGPKIFTTPSVMDIHAELLAQSFTVEAGDKRPVVADISIDAPDLASANLLPVAVRQVSDGRLTHYAGSNGCRLSYYRGTLDPDVQMSAAGNQTTIWSTADNVRHMIVATGMDQDKFDAIAAYLKLVTRQQASEQMMASLSEITGSAEKCLT